MSHHFRQKSSAPNFFAQQSIHWVGIDENELLEIFSQLTFVPFFDVLSFWQLALNCYENDPFPAKRPVCIVIDILRSWTLALFYLLPIGTMDLFLVNRVALGKCRNWKNHSFLRANVFHPGF